jgi:hypothetical protein
MAAYGETRVRLEPVVTARREPRVAPAG